MSESKAWWQAGRGQVDSETLVLNKEGAEGKRGRKGVGREIQKEKGSG